MTHHVNRDDIVHEALERWPTPEHSSEFWSELSEHLAAQSQTTPRAQVKLAAESPGARVDAAPADIPTITELRPMPTTPTRRHPRWLPAAAAVAVVAATAGLVGVMSNRSSTGDQGVQIAGQPAPLGTGADARDSSRAQHAALEWLDLMAEGDLRSAWEMLGPTARDAWVTFDAFEDARTGFSEGIALWATAERREVGTISIDTAGDEALHVTTISGVRHPEGMTEDSAVTILVREDAAGRHTIEPFFPAGSAGLRFNAPVPAAEPPLMDRDAPVVVALPAENADLRLILDRDASLVTPEQDGSGLTTFVPSGGWTPGRHTVTAVLVSGTGAPMAAVVVFEVQ
jgi:hypothetical protein